MGQAMNLPDSPGTNAAAPAGGADDLLSQLAGEEIDRLLAEADSESRGKGGDGESPGRPGIGGKGGHALAEATDAIDAQLGELFAELEAGPAGGESPAVQAGAEPAAPRKAEALERATADVSAHLDTLFAELDEPPSAGEPAGPEAPDEVSPAAKADVAELDAALAQDAERLIRSAEDGDEGEAETKTAPGPVAKAPGPTAKAAGPAPKVVEAPLGIEASQAEPASAANDPELLAATSASGAPVAVDVAEEPAVEVEDDDIDARLPLVLRPLEWINAPLAHCPPVVREALGKAAILTLINAVAVLLYVVLFRK